MVVLAVDFSRGSWGDRVARVSGRRMFQSCEIRVDWRPDTFQVLDFRTGEIFVVTGLVSELASELIELDSQLPGSQVDFDSVCVSLRVALSRELDTPVHVSVSVPSAVVGSLWVRRVDGRGVVLELSPSGWVSAPVDSVVYSGQARMIPVRASVWSGGEAQLNATSVRAVRFQVPSEFRGVRFHVGAIVTFLDVPFNGSLVGRTAKVTDDFQGSTTGSRTFNAMMDADSEDS